MWITSLLFSCCCFVLNAQGTFSLDPFDGVVVTGNIELTITKGENESMEVERDFSKLRFDVLNGVLRLKRRKLYSIREYEDDPIYITLTYRDIRSLKATAGANVRSRETVEADLLSLRFGSGAHGKMDLKVTELSVSVNEGAQLKLRGQVDSQNTAVTTGAILDARDMESQRAHVRASTGGEAEVNVVEYIYANANTGGDIEYDGEPEKVRLKDSLGGDVSPRFGSRSSSKRPKTKL